MKEIQSTLGISHNFELVGTILKQTQRILSFEINSIFLYLSHYLGNFVYFKVLRGPDFIWNKILLPLKSLWVFSITFSRFLFTPLFLFDILTKSRYFIFVFRFRSWNIEGIPLKKTKEDGQSKYFISAISWPMQSVLESKKFPKEERWLKCLATKRTTNSRKLLGKNATAFQIRIFEPNLTFYWKIHI